MHNNQIRQEIAIANACIEQNKNETELSLHQICSMVEDIASMTKKAES